MIGLLTPERNSDRRTLGGGSRVATQDQGARIGFWEDSVRSEMDNSPLGRPDAGFSNTHRLVEKTYQEDGFPLHLNIGLFLHSKKS
jgi:hypothetical protein